MRNPEKIAFRIVVAAAAATVVSSILAGRIESFTPGYFDENVYRRLARNLIDHGYYGYAPGQQIAWRPPGYPFFLAALRWIIDGQWFVRVVQAALAGGIVVLASSIARRLFGPWVAAATSVLLFVTGLVAVYASVELSETLATFLLVLAAWLVVHGVERTSIPWVAAGGIVLGLSVLTRPQGIVLIPAIALWLVLVFPKTRRRTAALTLIGASILAIAPWTIRNAVRLHAFVPVSTYGGVTLWMTNNPRATGRFPGSAAMMMERTEYERITALPEVEEDREYFRLALQFIRSHPITTVRNWIRDGAVYLGSRDTAPSDRLVIRDRWRLPFPDNRLLLPLAALGAIPIVRRRDRRALLPLFVVASFVLFFMVFLPVSRYRHGMHPFLAMYAAFAITWVAGLARRRTAA